MTDVSIHPRVVNGKTFHELVNTSKPWKGKSTRLKKRRATLGQRRVAREGTAKSLPSNMNPAAFRPPGSMNQHKR